MKFKKIANIILSKFIKNKTELDLLIDDLSFRYTHNRFYHNTKHIETLYNKSLSMKGIFNDFDCVSIAILFHDVIYDVNNTKNKSDISKTNEGLSAQYCTDILTKYNYNPKKISKIHKMIIATVNHKLTDDSDTNLFLDLDLSSLGSDPKTFEIDTSNIYIEYSNMDGFTNASFVSGRIKFIDMMLNNRNTIFLTKQFRHLEQQARLNLEANMNELVSITSEIQ